MLLLLLFFQWRISCAQLCLCRKQALSSLLYSSAIDLISCVVNEWMNNRDRGDGETDWQCTTVQRRWVHLMSVRHWACCTETLQHPSISTWAAKWEEEVEVPARMESGWRQNGKSAHSLLALFGSPSRTFQLTVPKREKEEKQIAVAAATLDVAPQLICRTTLIDLLSCMSCLCVSVYVFKKGDNITTNSCWRCFKWKSNGT